MQIANGGRKCRVQVNLHAALPAPRPAPGCFTPIPIALPAADCGAVAVRLEPTACTIGQNRPCRLPLPRGCWLLPVPLVGLSLPYLPLTAIYAYLPY